MAALYTVLAAEDVVEIYTSIDDLARAFGSADPRSMDQRRADIINDLLHGRPPERWLPVPNDPDGDDPDGDDHGPGESAPAGRDGGPDLPGDPFDDVDPADRDTPDPYNHEQPVATPVDDEPATTAGSTEPAEPAESAPAAASQPILNVTASRETMDGTSDDPAELAGYGPITAGTARTLAASGRAVIHCHDEIRHRLDAIKDRTWTAHDPPAKLRDAIRSRDGTCRWPGCRQPARRCDTDHTRRWPDGPTTECNLECLCRRHHRLKHATTWHVVQRDGGILDWTSPTGQHYTTYPRGPAIQPDE